MAKYKLLAQHFSEEDKLLEAGEEVGDGTEHAWTRPPTVEMEPLDAEAMDLIARERRRVGEHTDPTDGLAMTTGEAEGETQTRRKHRKRQEPPEPAADDAERGDEETAGP